MEDKDKVVEMMERLGWEEIKEEKDEKEKKEYPKL